MKTLTVLLVLLLPGALFAQGVRQALGRAADGRCRHVLRTCPECVLK